jgi:hypothetical protein
MPVRVGKLMREAMGHYARRIASGEQLRSRFDGIRHKHRKVLRELVRELLSKQEHK